MDELISKGGVYAVTVNFNGEEYYGVTNIGYNPTFGDVPLSVQTHLLDFSGNIVGKTIKLNFIQRLRDEKTFKDVTELSEKIAEDILRTRELFKLA